MTPGVDICAGTVLRGRFTVEGKLTEGGMSVLYTVSDLHLPGRWVLKQMRPLVGNPDDLRQIREQFRAEASLLAGLSHPGIPRVIDCFSEDGRDYLVEELVEGQTLEAILQARGSLPEREVVDLGLQILDILEYLHSKGIIYRDLKPGNLMLDAKGRVRLVDFGIARHFTPGRSSDTVIVGTPGYASPEHYGRGQTDARSDIYGLGGTLHALLTGRDPAEKPFKFTSPAVLVPGISSGLSQTIMKALALRPEERFQSALSMSETLRTCLAEAPERRVYPYASSLLEKIKRKVLILAGRAPSLTGDPRKIMIAVRDEGIDWADEELSETFKWEEIEMIHICRVAQENSRNPFYQTAAEVTVREIRITAKKRVLSIPPLMKDWRTLINWIVYRAGLTPSRTVREEGADLVYDRSG